MSFNCGSMGGRMTILSERMYYINANLSALIHIQKIKSIEQAEMICQNLNREIGEWIRLVREMEKVE